ncbi:OmpA family protein [Iodobacter fluviatilis]|uniref:OmpA family n=1 Tax=Iodobacter fluviatilis TaxID=537 RepID=A0A377Q504_9NEIS|nr:OmpA family protein [Iodobacter fluviatilis]TCU81533.1 OmpA family protein [Iodobacter fluviatilis]STQ89897.1 OmpA family [Iodobacter fluviatilis]
MKRSGFVYAALLVIAASVTGCAENPATPTATPSTSWKHAPVETTSTVTKAAETAAAATQAAVDPSFLKFDKMSAKLTPEHELQLMSLLPKLKEAKAITLRGYCYKKDIGNAKSAALARAVNVEKFLVKQGISKKKLSRRFNTEDAEHAVRVEIGK